MPFEPVTDLPNLPPIFRTLPFPQPCYPGGWWTCTMARKGADLTDFRERGAQTKNFPTRY